MIVNGVVDAGAAGSFTSKRPVESAGGDLKPAAHQGAVQVSVTTAPGLSRPHSVTGTPRWITIDDAHVVGSVMAVAVGGIISTPSKRARIIVLPYSTVEPYCSCLQNRSTLRALTIDARRQRAHSDVYRALDTY